MTPAARPTLLVLSHLRWDFVFQRPQHLLTRAARDGFDVVVVEEALHEAGAAFGRRMLNRGAVRVVQPLVPWGSSDAAVRAHMRGVVRETGAGATGPLWLWVYGPAMFPFARDLEPERIIFDKMDELSAFKFAPSDLVENEAALMRRADVVFTGGRAMYEAAVGRSANLHCFPSSIDSAHFAAARTGTLADPQPQRAVARPRVGFFGVIDERFDLALLRAVAGARPDWQFIMLGPVVKIQKAELPRAPNIHWLGGQTYDDLPAFLAHWDVGWMPFAINAATRFISPTKTPEFLAAGLPVVSTPIRDVVRPYGEEGLVAIAADAGATVAAIGAALGPRDPGWLARVDEKLAAGSWDKTWFEMRALAEAAGADSSEKILCSIG